MYDDYEIVYKSNLNEFLVIWIILGIVGVLLALFTIFAQSKVYKKANRSGIAPWIPIYNIYLLVEIANLPITYFLLTLIPIVNIYALYKINVSVATLFKKSHAFGVGLFLLPFIFYPILAFSDSEYIGINLFALQGTTTVEDIPIIDENKNKEIEVNVNDNVDVSSSNINISIGGGKYQKEYTSSLVDVDREKVVNKVVAEKEAKKNHTNRFINEQIIQEQTPEPPVQEEKPSDLFSVPFINSEPKSEQQVQSNPALDAINRAASNQNTSSSVNTNGEYKLCPNCGTRVSENSQICFVCGQKLH